METVSFKNTVCIKETDKAILVESEDLDGRGQVWIPKSVIDADSEVWGSTSDRNEGVLVVEEWFAEKEGLV
jgi:hypothetical protein